jgi:hypothetical protein
VGLKVAGEAVIASYASSRLSFSGQSYFPFHFVEEVAVRDIFDKEAVGRSPLSLEVATSLDREEVFLK